MKKIVTVGLIACLILSSIFACAAGEGLLPELDDLFGVAMPSFSAVLMRYPDSLLFRDDGSSYEEYNKVAEGEFDQFGVYLNKKDCQMGEYEKKGSKFEAIIIRNGKSFIISYDYDTQIATADYPAGTYNEYVNVAKTKYDQAIAEMKEESYLTAVDTFRSIKDYETFLDTTNNISECFYLEGQKYFDKENFHKAKECFSEVMSYKNSSDLVKECWYQISLKRLADSSYSDAVESLKEIIGYKDAVALLEEAKSGKRQNDIKNIKSKIEIGNYDGYDLTWYVVYVQNGRSLVRATSAVANMQFDENGKTSNWGSCSLKKWMDNIFYKEAFSESEKKEIIGTPTILSKDEMKKYDCKISDAWSTTKVNGYGGPAISTYWHSGDYEGYERVDSFYDVVPVMWIKHLKK